MWLEKTITIEAVLDWRMLWIKCRIRAEVLEEYQANGSSQMPIVNAVHRLNEFKAQIDEVLWQCDVMAGGDHQAHTEFCDTGHYQEVMDMLYEAGEAVRTEYHRLIGSESQRMFTGLVKQKDKPTMSLVKSS